MHSFTPAYLAALAYTPSLIRLIGDIHEFRGKQALFVEKRPEVLARLRQVAFIESIESSNRLENIEVGPQTLQSIAKNDPLEATDRPRSEMMGYRAALDTIHQHHEGMQFSVSLVRQLHHYLMQFTSAGGGEFKSSPNDIVEKDAQGAILRVRFQTVPPYRTQDYMERLHALFTDAVQSGVHDPLVLIPLYVHDFLCIHPFADGNGRMARLLTVFLLYRHGYQVARYVSLERIIEQTKRDYYNSLERSDQDWERGAHHHLFFTEYLLNVIRKGCGELEEKVEDQQARGAKTFFVLRAIEASGPEFSISELERRCPSVSRDTIRNVLSRLREQGGLESLGRGPGARWRKVIG